MKYQITRSDLREAVSEEIVTAEQADRLEVFFDKKTSKRDMFDLVHLAYYTGALVVILAMTWFVVDAWENINGWGLSGIALAYAVLFGVSGWRLYSRLDTRVLGGLLVTISVCLTPLFVYGIQKALGLWGNVSPGDYSNFYRWVNSGWFYMEISTVLVALTVMKWVRFSFLAAPLSVALWFISMDIAPLLNVDRRIVSMVVGFLMVMIAIQCDLRRGQDGPEYGFWMHLLGAIALWGGLSMLDSRDELRRAVYAAINVLFMLTSVVFRRRIYLILGAIGFYGYLGHLAWMVFDDSLYFPFFLAFFGILIMSSGLWCHRKKEFIEAAIVSRLPQWVKTLRSTND